jgi:hypothetical protein
MTCKKSLVKSASLILEMLPLVPFARKIHE